MNTKAALRIEARQRILQLTAEQRQFQSLQICENVTTLLQQRPLPKHPIIATFAAMSLEPNLLPLHEMLPDVRFVYPRCEPKGVMDFYHVNDLNSMVVSAYGIAEPDPALHQRVEPSDIDLILCPSWGFTKSGIRLGKGGGFYDRYLAKIPKTPKIGILFSQQYFDTLPTEAHDIAVDTTVSDADSLKSS